MVPEEFESAFALSALGSVDLRDGQGGRVGAILVQPKRLGLLVRLAHAGESGIPRELLLAEFWPEYSEARGRNALRQAIHFLRGRLGAASIRSDDQTVALEPGAVVYDAHRFGAAIADGDDSAALALWRGPFCDGLHVAGAPQFEEWLEGERSRLRTAAAAAAWRMSRAASDAAALRWAELACEIVPWDEPGVRALIEWHLRFDDHAGARRVYERFAEWLRVEFDSAPSKATNNAVAAARDEAPAAPASRPFANAASGQPAPIAVAATHHAPAPAPAAALPSTRRRWHRWASAATAAVLTVSVLLGLRWRRVAAEGVPMRIAVLPFTVSGDERLTYLGEGMVALLARRLDGLGELRVVDERVLLRRLTTSDAAGADQSGPARKIALGLGATHVVTGRVTATAQRVEIVATIERGDGSPEAVLRAEARGEDDFLRAIDAVARQIVALRSTGSSRLTREAALSSTSLSAVRSWLEGERAYRAGEYAAAADAFDRAIGVDSTFALAHYRYSLATAAASAGRSNAARRSLPAALRHSKQLSAHDQLMVRALYEQWYGSTAKAEQMYREAVAEKDDDAEAWFELGDLTFHTAPWSGRPMSMARPAFDRVLALDSTNLEAVTHLARIAAVEADTARLAALVARETALRAPSAVPGEIAWLQAIVLRNTAATSRMMRSLASATDQVALDYAWKAASLAGDPDVAARTLRPRTEGDRPSTFRATAMLSMAHFEAARGRPAATELWLDRTRPYHAAFSMLTEATLLAVAVPQESVVASSATRLTAFTDYSLRRAAAPLGQDSVFERLSRSYLEATVAALRHDTAGASRFASALVGLPPFSTTNQRLFDRFTLMASIRARLAAGDSVGALKQLDSQRGDANASNDVMNVNGEVRLLHARLLAAAGRTAEALTLLGSIPENAGFDAALVPSARLLRAQLLERAGDRATAAREAAAVLLVWRDAEPGMRGEVEAARAIQNRARR